MGKWDLKKCAIFPALFASNSLAIITPVGKVFLLLAFSSIISRACIVLFPGAAHISKIISLSSMSTRLTGTIATNSCLKIP